jgi:Carboxypeptidase regulatory-like domain
MPLRLTLLPLLLTCALVSSAGAQDFRGAITGRVLDSSAAALPGVAVTATSVSTNVASTTTTNNEGSYTILYLTPGVYRVAAELSGFKKLVREGVEVRVGDRVTLNLSLEVGQMEETISVTAETPLLELASGSAGQVIDEKRISLLPLSDGNPFTLTRLVPGVAYTGDLKFSRPFDNAGTSSINADGSTGGNEFSLDGSPNMASGRRVAYVPPAGAVQQFKVQTAAFDAADGHTAGAMVNVTLKSGTNALKGEGYYYLRDEKLSATDFFVNKSGSEKPQLSYERFGGHTGGPLWLPGYSGRDRTFFFTAVEWLYDEFPEPGSRTVPTEAQRTGDFSALLGQGIRIYDPATARRVGSRVVRDPFPGNIIPANRISPIAREVLKYYPQPNQAGNAQGGNNFFTTNPRTDDFYSIALRVDHRLTDKQQMFVRYTRNDRKEARNAAFGVVNGVVPTGNFLFRINDGLTADHVYTISGTTLLNVRGGWQRFQEPNVRQHEGLFDPATLGFPAAATQYFGSARYFPQFDLDQFTDIGDSLASTTTHSIYSFQPTFTRLMNRHSIKAGYDLRLYRERSFNPGRLAGAYQFRGNYTRAQDNGSNLFGQDLAAFMLGQPTGGGIDINAQRLNNQLYHGVFVQDDWKVTDKLTVNLGLRYEYEGAPTDAQNRNVRGFDPDAAIAIEAAAKAAYAANPIPEVAPSAFNVRGGLQFASDSARGFWNADANNIQPRVGFAYAINDRTGLRGGWGIYTVPFIFSNGLYQPGFAQGTSIIPTPDSGVTFRANLADPFPDGLLQPAGASNGANTNLGQGAGRFAPLDFQNAHNMRYSIGIQRELPHQWMFDIAYAGSRGYDLVTELDLNPVPAQYLSTNRERDQAVINFLGQDVANPFRGLIPGTGLTNPTTDRSNLLRPFPQFTGVTTWDNTGTSGYNSLQTKIEKRFTRGYTILASYTWSKFTEKVARLNATDTQLAERLSTSDVPHRFVISGVWELPFGRDRRWGNSANGLVDAFIGGWSVQAIGQMQTGRPFNLGNLYFDGDLSALKADYSGDKNNPVFDTSGFYFHDAAVQTGGVDDPAKQRADQRKNLGSNIRYFPFTVEGMRGQGLHLWDISVVKQVRFGDRLRAQFHVEFLNAFNHPVFNNPNTDPSNANFGKVTSQNNLPRDIQLAAKFVF